MNSKEELDALVGKKVQATFRKNKKDFPVFGKLIQTKKSFNRIEGEIDLGSGSKRWFTMEKITSVKK